MRGRRRPIWVLVVDDNPLFAKTIAAILSGEDRIALIDNVAPNGEVALHLAVSYTPDVILMDVDMPAMNGFEATLRLRTLGVAARVLILTAMDEPGNPGRARSVGASGYLTKERVATHLCSAVLELGVHGVLPPEHPAALPGADGTTAAATAS
jgi:DNA-binding NarL/FixJ family response regulator